MTEILKTTWHNFPALALESEAMCVIIVPDLGAKIVSLYDKLHLREWLVPPIRPVKQTAYGANFISQDMSGWDEMLPTITACEWDGAQLPDHGEVWSIPWEQESEGDGLSLSIDGTAFPYHFVRSAVLVAPGTLELGYWLTNTGQKAWPYLWAAHPEGRVPIFAVEMEVLGCTHADIGRLLAERWNLPPKLVSIIAGHHTPTAAGAFAVESSIVHLADILARALQLGSGGDPMVPPADHAAWDLLNLKPASLDDIMAAMLAEFDDISSFLR